MRRIFFFLGSPGRRAERSLALTDLFPVLRVLGMLMCLFAVAMLLPLGVAWSHGEAIWLVYPVAMVLTLALGLALWMILFARPLSVMVGDFVSAVGPEDLEGDPHEIGMVVQADRLHPFVLDGDLVPFRRGRRHRRQGKGHDLRPLRF